MSTTPRTDAIFGEQAHAERRVGHGAEALCRELEGELRTERARLRYLSELWMPTDHLSDPIAKWMKIGDHNRMCDAIDAALANELAVKEAND